MAKESTAKCDSVKLRGKIVGTLRGCKRGHDHEPVITKHEIPVKLSVMIRVANIRAIFMEDNVTVTSCAKHVDIR